MEDALHTEGNNINILKDTLEAQFNSTSLDLRNMAHEATIQVANRTVFSLDFSSTSSNGKVCCKQALHH